MNLFAKILKMKNNDRGESLVEVIVAMLILTIIIFPLLNSFGVTGTINLKSRNVQYATSVGKNVMEGLKEYGISGSSMQLNGFNTFKIVAETGELSLDYSECLNDFTTPLIIGDDSNGVECSIAVTGPNAHGFYPRLEKEGSEYDEYNETYAHKYYFYINNIKEGTKYYDAHIVFDANDFDPDKMTFENEETKQKFIDSTLKFNTFKLADLTTLNSLYAVVASPSGVFYQSVGEGDAEEYDMSKTPETEAVRVFQERYGVHMQKVYDAEIEMATILNNLVYDAIQHYIVDVETSPKEYDTYMTNNTERHKAFEHYKSTYPGEYNAYLVQGVSLEGDPVERDIDAITVGDSLNINNKTQEVKDRTFTGKIKRLTTIIITIDTTTPENPYVVNSSVTFTLDQTGYPKGLVCDPNDPDDAENAVYVCEGYFTPDTHFEAIDNIYLFQDAYKDSYGRFLEDTVELDFSGLGTNLLKNSSGKTSNPGFYVIWQYEFTGTPGETITPVRTNDSIEILFTGSREQAELFTLYSSEQMALPTTKIRANSSVTNWDNYTPKAKAKSIVSDKQFSDRAYNVTVEIFEHGGTEVLYTLNTTIKE